MVWDKTAIDFFNRHNWKIDNNGIVLIPKKDFENYVYTGVDIYNKNIKTLMYGGLHGSTLIFENKHFKII